MNSSQDNITTIQHLKDIVKNFVHERDWEQFHSPKNLAAKLAIEAGELLEKFVWMDSKVSFEELNHNRNEIENEAADVLFVLLAFCNASHIDIAQAFLIKLQETQAKYPIEKSKGSCKKYNQL